MFINAELETLQKEVRNLKTEFDEFKTMMLAQIQQTPPQVNLGPLQERIEKLERELQETVQSIKNMR